MSKILSKHLIGDQDVSFVDAALISVPFTSIQNRAQIRNPAADLKASAGIDRSMVQQAVELLNEFGPNGERVFKPLNDEKDLVRLVGNWSNDILSDGQHVAGGVGTYVEITFYGTGLNILCSVEANARDFRVTVDGGAEGSNIYPSSVSSILSGRNYSSNQVLPVVSNLALGLHTVKIRVAAVNLRLMGYEVLTESSQIRVNAGSLVKDQRKISLDSSTNIDLKPSSLSGARGGRVVVYNSGNRILQAVQAVAPSSLFLSSADHTLEEVVRVYNFREFGSNRGDDFSTLVTGFSDRGFTLDDGVTSLVGTAVSVDSGVEGIRCAFGSSGFLSLTFVGTGLDVQIHDNSTGTENYNIFVDGTNVGSLTDSLVSGRIKVYKIASGLPYGVHTVRFAIASSPSANRHFKKFYVYGPKKPVLPEGAAELADYNVLADYSNSSLITDHRGVPAGVISKAPAREAIYIGSWSLTPRVDRIHENELASSTAGNYFEYSFYGTGFVLVSAGSSGGTCDFQIRVNGVLNATGVALSNVTNQGGGTYRWTGGGGAVQKLQLTGLTLGFHTVRITLVAGGAQVNYAHDGFMVITPVHSHKSNLWADLQNTLSVGSQSIGDSRQLSVGQKTGKYRGTAVGLAVNPTTSSTAYVPMPDMSLVAHSNGGWFRITYQASLYMNTNTAAYRTQVYVNGSPIGVEAISNSEGTNVDDVSTDSMLVYLSKGVHKIDLYWKASSGSVGSELVARQINVEEL